MPLDDVTGDVADLRTAMLSLADRADRVHRYLAANDQSAVEARLAGLDRDDDTANMRLGEALDAQVRALARLRTQLDRLLAEMDHLVAALQAMHAEVIGLAAIPDAWRGRELSSRVSELQAQVGALGEGLEEAYAETRSSVERRR
jgi:hypothetical protein